MNSTLAVLVAVCGMLVVLAGLFLLLVLQVLRFGKRNTLMSLVQFLGGQGADAEEDQYTPLPEYKAPSSIDLRAKAESLDFDAAVQKYRQQSPASSTPSASTTTSQPFSAQVVRPGTGLNDLSGSKPINAAPLMPPTTPSAPSSLPPITPGKLSQRLSQEDHSLSSPNARNNLRRRREEEDEDDIMGGLISGEDPEALL